MFVILRAEKKNSKNMCKINGLMIRLTGRLPKGHRFYCGRYHRGRAKFIYIPTHGRQVLDGKFSYKRKLEHGRYRKAEGRYERNIKTGKWSFVRSGRNTTIRVEANFKDGALDGDLLYTCEERTIAGSMRTNLKMTIADGKVKGAIEGKFGKGSFSGRCDDNGQPHGTWSVVIKKLLHSNDELREVWRHGNLVYTDLQEEEKYPNPEASFFRARFNYILSEDINRLLSIAPQGSQNISLAI